MNEQIIQIEYRRNNMSLYIKTSKTGIPLGSGKTHSNGRPYHIEDFIEYYLPDATFVDEIYADTDELDLILRTFSNIPVHNTSPVQKWFGDNAKFIVANIHMYCKNDLKTKSA